MVLVLNLGNIKCSNVKRLKSAITCCRLALIIKLHREMISVCYMCRALASQREPFSSPLFKYVQ
jgi:hypothetical protein